ncbi:universal stress protein [Ramlibacter sp. H39-3-26]|uniref:universal stress protein n=1 Tax=Curvibacter soli TaxID=3031331 RepID=UPI0023D9C40E|nr:universal stress protein [Ramlibacter sp. H39-3-26]MDF1486043.1 universal stress protein [Ramlibacter sp. H39-3-26]
MTESSSWNSAPPRSILLSTDLGCRSDRALDRALQLARQWQARLVALTVLDAADMAAVRTRAAGAPQADPVQVAQAQLRADAAANDVPITVRVGQGAVADTVLSIAALEKAEFIVVGIARNEALGRVVLGSTVDALVRRADAPVLVVRARPRHAYERVVVATDFSATSRRALNVAVHCFAHASFTLFHAFNAGSPALADGGQQRALAVDAARGAALQACQAFIDASGLPDEVRARMHVDVAHGDPARLLDGYARDRQADLVVLGTQGRTGLRELLLGSVAQRVLEVAQGDVLVVRQPRAA